MRGALLLLLALTAACDVATAPRSPYGKTVGGDTNTGSPLLTPIDTPYIALMPGDTGFYAVKGRSYDVVLRFQSTSSTLGDKVLEFQLAAGSLLKRPDGTLIAAGDSVFIEIRPDTAGKMAFTFSPSGLVFDSTAPAVLTMWCNHAAADLNGDGVVNSTDEQLWYEMAIWKRESTTDPWTQQSTTRSTDGYQLQTPVTGFTGFSVAS